MDNLEYNFERICRACKSESDEMQSVFETNEIAGRPSKLAEMLMACASVQVICGDGLPDSMCVTCVRQLSDAYTFKRKCEGTDNSLRIYLKEKGIKQEGLLPTVNENDLANTILEFNSLYNNGSGGIKTEPSEGLHIIKNEDSVIFSCSICDKRFASLEGLKYHKKRHTGDDLHKCKICSKEYTRLSHLQRHIRQHGPRKVHICKICNKTLTRLEHLKRHMITHVKNKPHTCETCKRGFNRPDHLMNHVKRCKGDRPYVCEICNKGFSREDSLQVHMNSHAHNVDLKPMLESLDDIENHYIEVENYTGCSDFSDFESFDSENESIEQPNLEPQVDIVESDDFHKQLDDDDDDDNDDDNMDDRDDIKAEFDMDDVDLKPPTPEVPVKRKRGRPRKGEVRPPKPIKMKKNRKEHIEFRASPNAAGKYPCDHCDKVLSTLIGLEIHMRKHTGLKLFSCSVCSKKFTRSNHLKRHLSIHDENKPYTCDICPKTFSRRDHMLQHVKLHTVLKEHECEVCRRMFAKMEQLQKHKAVKHNIGEKIMNEKKYICEVCKKGFTTEKYRDVHMRGHTGDKAFQCKTCMKKFNSKSHLTEHVKFHNECSKKFLCSECGQRFIRNDYLVIHMRRHRGEKPFKCKYCGKGFPRTTDLTVHERYHTGEKTHLCMVCGRGFGRAYNLTVHMRTHTGEKPYQCTYCDAAFAQGNDLKAHVRRHTGERYHCDMCTESFLMGYLLTQHKRTVHGVIVHSHIRRLQPSEKVNLQPIGQTIQLPTPSVTRPSNMPIPIPVIPTLASIPLTLPQPSLPDRVA